MTEVLEVEPTKVSLSYEVKIGLPNYSNVVARAFVERRVTDDTDETRELSAAFVLAQEAVDGALADFGGIAAVVPQVKAERTSKGKTEELSLQDLAAKFGASVEDEPMYGDTDDDDRERSLAKAPKPQSSGLRVIGKQHGDLPDWIFKDAADAGVTKIFDNRDGLEENPKRPWFKDADGGRNGKAFWPPKGRK